VELDEHRAIVIDERQLTRVPWCSPPVT